MTAGNNSTHKALQRRIGRHPTGVCLLLDPELATLLQHLPSDPGLKGRLLGEGLLRLWLYRQRCPEGIRVPLASRHADLLAVSSPVGELFPATTSASDTKSSPTTEALSAIHQMALDFARRRFQDYCRCDGLIAVIGQTIPNEAIAIPFSLGYAENDPGAVRDRAGRLITRWHSEIATFRHLLSDIPPRVTICCDCGPDSETLKGGSFAIPVLLAWKKKQGVLADYPALSFLSTGAISDDGRLETVNGIQAKADLARRLGTDIFVYPEESGLSIIGNGLSIPIGSTIDDMITIVDKALEDRSLGTTTVQQACKRIKTLQDEIHYGTVSFPTALKRIARYEKTFNTCPDSEHGAEGMVIAHVVRSAIANHSGDPETGRRHSRQAAAIALKRGETMKYIDAATDGIVSLVDLGLLDEAMTAGRELLQWVADNPGGDADTRLKARMKTHGAFGGQALLQLSLHNPDLIEESRSHSEKALQYARQLDHRYEIAFDLAQLALWHALFNSDQAQSVINDYERELQELGDDGRVSLQFVRNFRFLSAYRQCLVHTKPDDGFAGWRLPERPDWVVATALKYRGTLLAASGDFPAASRDFQEAVSIIGGIDTPLLRFIGATVALQGGESLRQAFPEMAVQYLAKATSEFKILKDVLYGPHRDPAWIARAEILVNGADPQGTDNPQLRYRY